VENTFNHIDELIGKQLSGETSREENVILRSWLEQSETNRKHYDQFKLIFTQASAVRDIQQYDADAAWNKVRAKLHQKKAQKPLPLNPNPPRIYSGASPRALCW
jgi:hypothetical protein